MTTATPDTEQAWNKNGVDLYEKKVTPLPTKGDTGELPENIEHLLRFNCPNGCEGKGSYPEMDGDGEWEQGQCQWCFQYGMPGRLAIKQYASQREIAMMERTQRDFTHGESSEAFDEGRKYEQFLNKQIITELNK